MNKPCKECPYRKESAPGWLGECSGDPVEFLKQLELPFLHPCHLSVDWDNDDEFEVINAPVCNGVLQFTKNICKLLYHSPYEEVRRQLKVDNTIVFGTRHEFINHHLKNTK